MTVTKYEFIVIRQGNSAQGPIQTTLSKTLYVAADGRQMRDIPDPDMKRHTIYVDNTDGSHYVLDANKKTFYTVTDTQIITAAALKGTSLGTKTIQGLPCRGYETNQSNGASSQTWWCTDAVSGTDFIGESSEDFKPAVVGLHEYIQKLTKNVSVPDTFFNVPSGYQFDNSGSMFK
jgi:hypothetical protein